MLVRFNVGNYLSFKDVQEFSMIKGKTEDKAEHLFKTGQIEILKFASVFGANASGKSNLISSIKFAQDIILHGIPKRTTQSVFRMDPKSSIKPSYFEFEIIIDDKNYSYGFEIILDKRAFISEWLIELCPSGVNNIIFERDIPNSTITTNIDIKSKTLLNKYEVYCDDVKSNCNVLFLKEMNRSKSAIYKEKSELSIFSEVYDWFKSTLDVNIQERQITDFSYFKDDKNKPKICRVISALGTGITNYEKRESSLSRIRGDLPKAILDKIDEYIIALKEQKKNDTISVHFNGMFYLISVMSGEVKVHTIAFNHGTLDWFNFDEESDGTRRILDLIEILFEEKKKVYFIDEIDKSLHPQLTYRFIKEFLEASKAKNIQLIITTHEQQLLNFDLLRQDEIWIASKNKVGETSLYSLDEYNVRFDQKVDKAYLEGRYGGVPDFDDTFPLDCEMDL
ncbi:MAG: ATP/GTP-binding protein [Clostridia bacterium]